MSTMKPMEAIRCTLPNCQCDCFTPGKTYVRTCDTCKHGWVAHALDKLGPRNVYQLGMQVEIVQPNIVFDIASLMLYGSQATPIRLKILLDRLFSVLQHEEVLQVLHSFGWSYEDYARGYILQEDKPVQQDPSGRVLDKWMLASREEEALILQQFLRFGETRSIAQEIILQDTKELQEKYTIQTPKSESEIKKFIERSNIAMQSFMRAYDARQFYVSRFAPYSYAAATGTVPQGARMVSPPLLHRFSPPNRETKNSDSTPAASPNLGSPLNRLQTMQPFDYRREQASPMISPVSSEISGTSRMSPHPSPQNLTVPSNPASSSPSPSQPVSLKQEKANDPEYYDIKPEDTEEALNFSTKDNPVSLITQTAPHIPPPSVPVPTSVTESSIVVRDSYEGKRSHNRKATNPIKRHWQPTAAFGGNTFVSPSGKKRVICTACNKTFCDKGALKIHYSAVHLKEMHKCTVEGCNMVFSSRRSRNRHSANPNPKLHLPQNRRKLPEGARVVDEGKPCTTPPLSSLMNVPHRRAPSPGEITPGNPPMINLPAEHKMTSPTKHHVLPMDMPTGPPLSEQRYFLQQPALDPENIREAGDVIAEGSSPSPTSTGDDKGDTPTGGRSKRKSMMPTRCAQMDDSYPGSDDNNSHDGSHFQEHQDHSLEDQSQDSSHDSGHYLEAGEPLQEGEGLEEPDDMSEAMQTADSDGEYDGPQDLTIDTKRNGEHHSSDDANMEDQPFLGPGLDAKPPDDSDIEEGELLGDSVQMSSPGGSDDSEMEGIDIPFDTENPRKCPACGKLFPNHFIVKAHYQNVHLKLMHICSIEGCNAAFPSKRSRDRHNANLNLHRKLLSTSSDGVSLTKPFINQNLRDEFLPKIYENHCLSQNGIGHNEEPYRQDHNGPTDEPETNPLLNGNSSGTDNEDSEEKNQNTMVECHVCQELFKDNLALKEHFETTHPKETYRCTVTGCDKIFSTRKSRNRHSQNDALHKHISPEQISAC